MIYSAAAWGRPILPVLVVSYMACHVEYTAVLFAPLPTDVIHTAMLRTIHIIYVGNKKTQRKRSEILR